MTRLAAVAALIIASQLSTRFAEAACAGTLLADSSISGSSSSAGFNTCSNPWNGITRGYYVAASKYDSTMSPTSLRTMTDLVQTGTTISFNPKPIYSWGPSTSSSDFGGYFSSGDSKLLVLGQTLATPFDCGFLCYPRAWGFPVLRWQTRAGQTARCYSISVTASLAAGCDLLGLTSDGVAVRIGNRIRNVASNTAPWALESWTDVTAGGPVFAREYTTQDVLEQVEVSARGRRSHTAIATVPLSWLG